MCSVLPTVYTVHYSCGPDHPADKDHDDRENSDDKEAGAQQDPGVPLGGRTLHPPQIDLNNAHCTLPYTTHYTVECLYNTTLDDMTSNTHF